MTKAKQSQNNPKTAAQAVSATLATIKANNEGCLKKAKAHHGDNLWQVAKDALTNIVGDAEHIMQEAENKLHAMLIKAGVIEAEAVPEELMAKSQQLAAEKAQKLGSSIMNIV